MNKIFLKPKEEDRILLGHPWIFDNEIGTRQGDCATGEVVDVFSKSGFFLGRGIINGNSRIAIRLFTRDREEPIDGKFFLTRVTSALEARSSVYAKEDSYRLLFAESDFVPGLIVDRFADVRGRVWLSAQFLTLAVDRHRDEIVKALREVLSPAGIFERSDARVRLLEGLEEKKGWIYLADGVDGAETTVTIVENGVRLRVDIENGQKTGYFLDQKDNRARIAPYAKGVDVLDTFSHTGAFGLNACKGGARSVLSVDISPEAVSTIDANIALNGYSSIMKSREADVFDLLKEYDREGKRFGLIVLDPPAFTKSAKMVEKAYGGYKEINLRAMKIINSGGYLVTCSCSHFFGADLFYRMLEKAAADAHKTIQVIGKYGPGPDHPTLLGYPESDYLKCAILRVW